MIVCPLRLFRGIGSSPTHGGYPRRWLALLCFCFGLVAPNRAHPAPTTPRNPLNTILADTADERSPGIKNETFDPPLPSTNTRLTAVGNHAPPHLANVHDGDFALYRALDFDSGVAAFKATVAGPRSGTLELHLDSPTGPILVTCPFKPSGGWEQWQDITANVDNSQAGVRDVYVLFRVPLGETPNPHALVNLRSFVFLKSVVTPNTGGPDLASRLDSPDDSEPQGIHAWGVPEKGFVEMPSFSDHSWQKRWVNTDGLKVSVCDAYSGFVYDTFETIRDVPLFTYTASAYLNETDTGGEWRILSQGTLKASFTTDQTCRPGIGFASRDGKQAIYVTLNFADGSFDAWRKLADGTETLVHRHPLPLNLLPGGKLAREVVGTASNTYTLRLDWSPYSDTLIASLFEGGTRLYESGKEPVANFRTVIDLPAARYPLLVNTGDMTAFSGISFSPTLDAWNYRWEWLKQPVLTPDVCNPAVWRGPNGQMYMMWRKFGADNFHGIAKSDDGVHWTRVTDEAIKCTGDMTVLPDPFGDGKWYATPGGANLPWWTSDGSDDFKTWTKTDKTVGDIFGHNRIQEIIDTQKYPQLKPIRFQEKDYRFFAYCEDWVHAPQPHSVVLLSNTLTDWVQPTADPVIPPASDFWGEKGNAIGSAFPLPDGNILISCCSCTNAGYTGAPEPTNITAIASGTEPWKILKRATLPDAPVSRENVWYQGPNFGTALFYDDKSDTLFFYGGFHDYHIGMMRVRHFLHPE